MEASNNIRSDKEIKDLVEKWKGVEGNLIMILHTIQDEYGYIPRHVSFELQKLLDIPLARIYEVITFYNYFKLEPPGKHKISLCMGTACYLKGGVDILGELKSILHIEPGQTTKDGLFTIELVRCLGCCGLSPVMMIDGKIYGKLSQEKIPEILTHYIEAES
ncbi:MAG: NAD(P)H-dependent oxidoreductase subunit E [Candidatus Omnitrophica bacterium]|nr:NAD(P)H-dependent oxidoreductase subunit E [Candidatus Omnitrophota bacterium]MDD5429105.1 NAD(P)H-dependent oxidoreductase subunit E [Candidatus Omnitrophota bacterium]